MSIYELILLAVVLAMDAFAVSICKGLSVAEVKIKHGLICGAYFGVFQAMMPVIGYFAGRSFSDIIASYDHWAACILLGFIGISMIKESREDKDATPDFGVRGMLLMAVATSIDALAVGVTFAFLKVNILMAASFIGVITFMISFAGVMLGNVFGKKYGNTAELIGGCILIILGLKILLQHLRYIRF